MISKQKKNDTVDVTKEEKKIIQKIQPKVAKINRQSKQKFTKVIKKHGLTPKRFQQIMLVLRTNPKVAQRFQKIVMKQRQQKQK